MPENVECAGMISMREQTRSLHSKSVSPCRYRVHTSDTAAGSFLEIA